MKVSPEQSYRLYKIVDKAKKVNHEAVEKMVRELGLDSNVENVFYSYLKLQTFEEVYNFLTSNNLQEAAENFLAFTTLTKSAGLDSYLKYDPTIVRGLDYYTGIVFEIFDKHPDNRRALCGGGAFANLLQIFNEDQLAGVGLGLGDVTLRDFLEVHNLLPNFDLPKNDVLLTYQEDNGLNATLVLAKLLRQKKLNVVTILETLKIKKVFPLAEKKGAAFVILMGADEISQKKIQLKNLHTKEQTMHELNDLESILKTIKA